MVGEAEQIADDVGLARLTLTALAERLGVRQPSLNEHVDGMDGLQRRIAVRAKNELTEILAGAAVGRSRGDAVASMSRENRHWTLDHPGHYAAAQRAPVAEDAEDEAASRAVVQVCADNLAGYEIHDDDAIDAIRAMRAALHGFVTLEAGGGFALPVDVDRSFHRLVNSLVTAFSSWTQAPTTAWAAR